MKRLPRGLQSYPQCKAKASIYRNALDHRPLTDGLEGELPTELVDLIRTPLLVSTWMETTKAMAVLLAIVDRYEMSDARYYDFIEEMNDALFRNRVYAALMSFASPNLLLRAGAARFGAFHQGTTLEVTSSEDNAGIAVMRYPSFLFEPLLARGFAVSFRVALSHSRARGVRVDAEEVTDRCTRFRVSWR